METTHSYTAWAAQQREGGPGLNDLARIDAMLASIFNDLHRRALRRLVRDDARARRDAREQFMARLAGIAG
jgi:hypothetical protein